MINTTVTATTPPSISKAFNPNTIAPGGTSTLTVTVNNPTVNPLANVAWSDSLPIGVVTAGSVTTTCAGTVSGIGITNGTVAANQPVR